MRAQMHELRRLAYLSALGIDSYVSRSQLPGAAPTRRLAVIPARRENAVPVQHAGQARPDSAVAVVSDRLPADSHTPVSAPEPSGSAPMEGQKTIRFSLAAVVAGGLLWLEELGDLPLAREQVHLIAAMARALSLSAGAAADTVHDVSQFDWPIHHNAQLDQGEGASRAAVAGFIGRKLEQHACRGMVLLGESSPARVDLGMLPEAACVRIPGTLAMLSDPRHKKRAWTALLQLPRPT